MNAPVNPREKVILRYSATVPVRSAMMALHEVQFRGLYFFIASRVPRARMVAGFVAVNFPLQVSGGRDSYSNVTTTLAVISHLHLPEDSRSRFYPDHSLR